MAATVIRTPTIEEVSGFMQDLLGLEVAPATGCEEGHYSVATYKNESGETVAYIKCDLGTGCRLGAALTQVPPPRAEEAIGESQIPGNLAENLDEIFNISVNLIAIPENERLKFAGATHGEALGEAADLESHEFCFQVERYGNCRLVISS